MMCSVHVRPLVEFPAFLDRGKAGNRVFELVSFNKAPDPTYNILHFNHGHAGGWAPIVGPAENAQVRKRDNNYDLVVPCLLSRGLAVPV